MKIWYLIGRLSIGGTERTLVDLANGLDREQYDVTVWTIASPGPLAGDLSDHIGLRSLDAQAKVDVRAPLRFVRALRQHRPSVLQSFLFFDNNLARFAGQFAPELTVLSGVRSVPNARARHREYLDRLTVRLADYVVSNSVAGAKYARNLGVPAAKTRVIRNGRDLEEYADATLPEDLRGMFGDRPVVGTVGRLIVRKGHYDLLDAWPLIRESVPDAQLVVVGDGPERAELAATARKRGIEDSVHLLGFRKDVPALLALFDVFAFPSHFEGLPGALLEAMAAGLPIVCTPVDGNSELVSDGEHGIHVPARAPSALADGLVQLLTDCQRAARLGDRAQERAFAEFTLDRMVAQFESLYDEIG